MDIARSILVDPIQRAGIAATFGVVSHYAYFIHGEHHLQANRLAQLAFIFPVLTGFALTRLHDGIPISQAANIALQTEGSFLIGLWMSMLIYRAFFHRLRSFPGPISLKLSKFAHLVQLRKLDNHRKLDKWHRTYGDFVRTGPNELSIVAPEAAEAVMGSRSSCTKSDFYDIDHPLVSVQQTRDQDLHDKRRRVWDRGFSIKALASYQSRLEHFSNFLTSQIRAFGGAPLDASLWFNYYSFDVMGELAFGKSFDMLKTGETHYAIKLLSDGQRPVGVFGPMPWLSLIVSKIPGISAAYKRWLDYCEEQVTVRKNMEVKERDIMSWLLEAEPMSNDAFKSRMWMVGDSRLIIVAGSDTTASTLTHMFYHLARDRPLVEKLRKELSGLQKEDGSFDVRDLVNANLLNAIINETLRLHPPVPSGLLRKTPPEGIIIGDRRIPGNVTVTVPAWVMGRSPKAYEKPLEFIPERWSTKADMVLNKTAFAPFSLGRYGCVGKNLAFMQLRGVTAQLITNFDISFAPGEDGKKLLDDTEEYFTLGLAELKLRFTERKV